MTTIGAGRGRAFLLAAALLSGCGREDGAAPSPPPAAVKGQVESNAGTWRVDFQTAPDPIPMNQPFAVRFTVSPKAGAKAPAPAPEASVEIDARMPAHGHGMNVVPKLSRNADGTWRAEGMLFHMPGHWELYFDITSAGRTERAQVDVQLR